MLNCKKCGVQITGERKRCPLCQGELNGTPEPDTEVFPRLPDNSGRYHLIFRLLIFLSIAGVVICAAVAVLLPQSAGWWWYVAAAVVCMWLCLANVLWRRHNIPKNILWMIFWLSLLSFAWDYFTGLHRWSLDYVIPFLCVVGMAALGVIGPVIGLRLQEYLIYLIIDALFGVAPALFLLFGWSQVRWPAVVSVAMSVLSFAALLVFQWDNLKVEIKKRLHL